MIFADAAGAFEGAAVPVGAAFGAAVPLWDGAGETAAEAFGLTAGEPEGAAVSGHWHPVLSMV